MMMTSLNWRQKLCKCLIKVMYLYGDLNARISNHLDFIENENVHNTLQDMLPEDYVQDFNFNRNPQDKVFNSQGQQLIDLCIASQLRVLHGRFVGDSLRNMTCFKSSGSSTIDYALASVDLINSISFFQILDPSYLSDHAQIVVFLKCNISIQNISRNYKSSSIDVIFKWENISKEKLYTALGENNIKR